jgi:hypothetical protein
MIQKIDHLETMIGSLNKLLLDAKNKGVINNKELSLLNLVYNLLKHNCYYDLNNKNRKKLESLYYKILNKYSFLCKTNITLSCNTQVFTTIREEYINTSPNTAPVISDPIESEPQVGEPPKICENAKGEDVSFRSNIIFTKDMLAGCFEDPNDYISGGIKNIKITSLPTLNPFTYQGFNVTVGQVIDVTTLNDSTNALKYNAILNNNIIDNFGYQVSTTSYPLVYNEEVVTMFINIS